MKEINFKITGMHCKACALGLEENIEKLQFVKQVSVNFETGILNILCDDNLNEEEIIKVVQKSGFDAEK